MNTYNTLVPVINSVIFDIQLIAVRASGFAFVKKKIVPWPLFDAILLPLYSLSCISIFTIKLSIFIYFILLLLYSYNF